MDSPQNREENIQILYRPLIVDQKKGESSFTFITYFSLRSPAINNAKISVVLRIRISGRTLFSKPLRPREDADFFISDKVDNNHWPGRMGGYVIVKFGCQGSEGRQTCPWYRRKVVMFIMISNLGQSLSLATTNDRSNTTHVVSQNI